MVIAYKWGVIAFDDRSLAKILTLPSNAKDDVPITFHDEDGNDYQVPGGKVFIAGRVAVAVSNIALPTRLGRIGESDTADGAISKDILKSLKGSANSEIGYLDILGVYATGKYITGETSDTTYTMLADTIIYGVEITA